MAGYRKVYNIEMGPHEDQVVAGLFGFACFVVRLDQFLRPAAAA